MRFAGLALMAGLAAAHAAQWGGELRFCLRSEPKTFHPALVDDDASETVRYLTGGVLVRVNRLTQELEPELAVSWQEARAGRSIRFRLREGVKFSDGTPFTADDVAYTIEVLMDAALHSPTGDAFRSAPGAVKTVVRSPRDVEVIFPAPVAGAARLFDQVAILSRHSPLKERAVLGPFHITAHQPGSHLLLARNPYFWKMEGSRRLPYVDAVRLDIQANREFELLRLRRGELDLATLDAEQFEQVAAERKLWFTDAGPTLEGELLWFNMKAAAPLPAYKKAWFASRNFRRAVSHGIRRDDLCRVVYRGHAQPGVGPFSSANRFWFNAKLRPHAFDLKAAREFLRSGGFRLEGPVLKDREGHPVEFSLVTNAGSRSRERAAAMIQQDLAAIGIKVHVAALDFPSLLERMGKSFRYEACLLGLINVDLDPNGQMNVWLSSSSNHQWNPSQPKPETEWEAEIDRLMRAQAGTTDRVRRKALFDRVQEIVWEEAPFLYLANRNALAAASPRVKNLAAAALRPQLVWNVERLWLEARR